MTVQKFIKYTPLDLTGKPFDSTYELTLNVLEKSGNYLLHKDLLRHYNSQRQGSSSTKTRSEVRGGGRKPWQQKGTGRARAGSSRSPLWKGGGVIFGPKPKISTFKLNKKERKLSLQTLLYNKKNNILIVDQFEEIVTNSKTKNFLTICSKYLVNLDQPILIVVAKKTPSLKLATQNVKNIELILASHLNTFSLLQAKKVLITPLALNIIKEIYCE